MNRLVLLLGFLAACTGGPVERRPPPVVALPLATSLSPPVAKPPLPATVCTSTCEVGMACTVLAGEASYACTRDGSTRLQCHEGVYRIASTCKGPKACAAATGKVECDDSLGDVADPCVHALADTNYACTTDGATEVVCDVDGILRPANGCRGPKGCYIADEKVHCYQSVAREGDPCRPVSNHSCTEDATAELRCPPELHWALQRRCPRSGCKITDNEVYCE